MSRYWSRFYWAARARGVHNQLLHEAIENGELIEVEEFLVCVDAIRILHVARRPSPGRDLECCAYETANSLIPIDGSMTVHVHHDVAHIGGTEDVNLDLVSIVVTHDLDVHLPGYWVELGRPWLPTAPGSTDLP